MDDIREFGKRGEEVAARRLSSLGYRILERNFRTPAGEVDIIAMDGGVMVFVEVKSRRDMSFGPPELAVNRRKIMQVQKAALTYLARTKKGNIPCRFDVVAVSMLPGEETRVDVIKDAFEMSGGY